MDIKLGQKLGEGGFGTVYAVAEDPDYCVKISNKNNNCRVWKNEYEKIMDIHSKLRDNETFKNLKYVRLIYPTNFIEGKNGDCYMFMNRIYRPKVDKTSSSHTSHSSPSPSISSALLKSASLSLSSPSSPLKNSPSPRNNSPSFAKYDKKTLHSLFGEKRSTYKTSERGEFIGINILQKLFSLDEIKKVAYELGKMMALLHFVSKNDAVDVELYVGVEYKTRKTRIYISDFDLSEKINDYTDEVIEDRMAWSLSAMPYFPSLDSSKLLYEYFKRGYKKVANNDEVVEKLFSIYR
jgi:hypothetical protein